MTVPANHSTFSSRLRRLRLGAINVLTKVQHTTGPVFGLFVIVHLSAPLVATLGGSQASSQVMVRAGLDIPCGLRLTSFAAARPRVLPDAARAARRLRTPGLTHRLRLAQAHSPGPPPALDPAHTHRLACSVPHWPTCLGSPPRTSTHVVSFRRRLRAPQIRSSQFPVADYTVIRRTNRYGPVARWRKRDAHGQTICWCSTFADGYANCAWSYRRDRHGRRAGHVP